MAEDDEDEALVSLQSVRRWMNKDMSKLHSNPSPIEHLIQIYKIVSSWKLIRNILQFK